jgi:hypothetical protein
LKRRLAFSVFFRIIILIPFLSPALRTQAQKAATLTGSIVDGEGKALKFATIEIRFDSAAAISAYEIADGKGQFSIELSLAHRYFFVTASLVGYKRESRVLRVDTTDKMPNLVFRLVPEIMPLKEVTVRSQRLRVKTSGDTISFKADLYRDSTEKVAEDLFRKIPGMEIDKDGAITFNGKRIDKILVEGDDLFNKHYTILSRNLSADLIDKIQVIDKYQENTALRGIKPSTTKVLNITLKKERKKILFGKLDLAIGNDGRYEWAPNLISFTKDTKIFYFSNLNSTGRTPLTEITDNSDISQNAADQQDDLADDPSLIKINKPYTQNLSEQHYNFNSAKLNAVSFVNRPGAGLTLKGLVYFYTDLNRQYQDNLTIYNLNNTNFSLDENSAVRTIPHFFTGDLVLTYEPKPSQRLEYTFLADSRNLVRQNSLLANGDSVSSALASGVHVFTNKLEYTFRLNDSSALRFKGVFSQNTARQDLSSRERPGHTVLVGTNDSLLQSANTRAGRWSLMSEYLRNQNQSLWSVTAVVTNKWLDLLTGLDSFAYKGIAQQLPDSFQNNCHASRISALTKFSYTYGGTAKFKFIANVEGAYHSTSIPIGGGQNNYLQQKFYVTPTIGGQYQTEHHHFGISYAYNYRLPDLINLSDGLVQVDYRTYQRFYTSPIPMTVGGLFASYSFTDWKNGLLASANLFASNSKKPYAESLFIDSAYSISSNSQEFYNETMENASFSISQFIPFISSAIKFFPSFAWRRYDDFLNGIFRKVNTYGSFYQVSLRSAFRGLFNYDAGAGFDREKATAIDTVSNMTVNQRFYSYLDLTFKLSSSIWLRAKTDHYHYYQSKGKSDYFFVDMDMNYDLLPNKFSIQLTGQNLLNTSKLTTVNISDYSTENNSIVLLPRFLMLDIIYKF